MAHLKAIETKYNGYRFRSRLEARWAVFFDSWEVKYEYEPEGFDLSEVEGAKDFLGPSNTWYLPDFYLPDYNYYVEIKPDISNASEEFKKPLTLAKKKQVMIVFGSPGIGSYEIYVMIDRYINAGITWSFAEGRYCDRIWFVQNQTGGAGDLNCHGCWSPRCEEGRGKTWAHRGLERAYEAARSARF